jgi:hypothetical protein
MTHHNQTKEDLMSKDNVKNEISTIFSALSTLRMVKVADKKPKLEGISFRYKTVQFHLIDDLFEEIERNQQAFGDCKIYSERFSLPGYGEKNEYLTGDEYQYEIIIGIESKDNLDVYHSEMQNVLDAIERKHDVHIYSEPYQGIEGEGYNIHKIVFYTNEDGVFPKE